MPARGLDRSGGSVAVRHHVAGVRVGFTGTQVGMAPRQRSAFAEELSSLSGSFHHGDCVGADEEAHAIARGTGWWIVVHPPLNPAKRAWCQGDVILPAKDYLPRNHDIAAVTEILLATPKTMREELYSGTWATVRYARKLGRPVRIIWLDGSVTR